jgi:hypothetical protein
MNRYILSYKLFEKDEFRPEIYRNIKTNDTLKYKLLNLDKVKFNDLYSKYKWYTLNKENKSKLKNNLFVLVNLAYDDIGGHVRINTPEKVQQDTELTFWSAMDNNNDSYADVLIFGKKTPYGVKISGIGHNRTKEAKEELFNHLAKILNKRGFYLEASDKPAEILLSKNAPVVRHIDKVKKIFNSPNTKYIDQSNIYYDRHIESQDITVREILFGNPIV